MVDLPPYFFFRFDCLAFVIENSLPPTTHHSWHGVSMDGVDKIGRQGTRTLSSSSDFGECPCSSSSGPSSEDADAVLVRTPLPIAAAAAAAAVLME